MTDLAPMLASPADVSTIDDYINDDRWVMQQKLDGHRVIMRVATVGEREHTFLTRNGRPYTKGVPAALRIMNLPSAYAGVAFDGELVDGVLWVFDVIWPELGSDEWTDSARLWMRIERMNGDFPVGPHLRTVPVAFGTGAKRTLFVKARSEHFEGVIMKNLDSYYEPFTRSKDWLKFKFVVTADCVVTGVNSAPLSADLGLMDYLGRTVNIGACSLIGKPAVKVGDVVEVRYLYAAKPEAPRLYQPTLIALRDDKTASECRLDQLVFTDKRVMETL